MTSYHYTESGLDNIIIEADWIGTDDEGEQIVTIPAIGLLHQAIAQALIDQIGALSGNEIRFLRTEMGMTQAEFARVLHRDTQTVGRWERGEVSADPTHDMIIRQLASERLELDLNASILDQSERVIATAIKEPIRIKETSDPKKPYELVA